MAVNDVIKYAELKDEHIDAIKRRIETFAKKEELFDGLYNHEKWDKGSKTMLSRRVVAPKIAESQVKEAVEDVAPRPKKVVIETFKHEVGIYRTKYGYTAEDIIYGYDDIVKIAGDTLADDVTQQLNWIKAKPLVSSRCIITPEQVDSVDNVLKTLDKGAIVLQKNGSKAWLGGKYLCLATPEEMQKVRDELAKNGSYISEPTKEMIDSGIIGSYGRWLFKEIYHDKLYNGNKQYLVLLGKRPNGLSPLDCAKIDGVEIINNPLGSGVLLDEDGNYTSDDNKQRGSVAANINGIGAYVNDDLCVLDCEITISTVDKSLLAESDKTGFVSVSSSPRDIEVTLTAGSGTKLTPVGLTYDATASKYFANPNVIFKCVVAPSSTGTLTVAANSWSVTANKGAKIVGTAKTNQNYDTVFVELENGAESFTLTCTGTAA